MVLLKTTSRQICLLSILHIASRIVSVVWSFDFLNKYIFVFHLYAYLHCLCFQVDSDLEKLIKDALSLWWRSCTVTMMTSHKSEVWHRHSTDINCSTYLAFVVAYYIVYELPVACREDKMRELAHVPPGRPGWTSRTLRWVWWGARRLTKWKGRMDGKSHTRSGVERCWPV